MLRLLPKRIFATSHLRLPAVPALLEHYVEMLGKLFALQGRAFSAAELDHLRGLLAEKLEQGFGAARGSTVLVEYTTDPAPKQTISYTFALEVPSLEREYAAWAEGGHLLCNAFLPVGGYQPDPLARQLSRLFGRPSSRASRSRPPPPRTAWPSRPKSACTITRRRVYPRTRGRRRSGSKIGAAASTSSTCRRAARPSSCAGSRSEKPTELGRPGRAFAQPSAITRFRPPRLAM